MKHLAGGFIGCSITYMGYFLVTGKPVDWLGMIVLSSIVSVSIYAIERKIER